MPAAAQLTPDQRVQDFLELASAFNKFYAPANWKIDALGVNLFLVGPYLQRVRAATNDAEYFEVKMEYVTALEDGHSGVQMPSEFRASLGIGVDLYDDKVLIESISARYPVALFPFQVGDELVSIDGEPVGTILDRLVKLQSLGNERPTRRLAAAYLTSRPQAVVPSAFLIPGRSDVVIRRATTDALEQYVLTWLKSGTPVVNLPRRPDLILQSVAPKSTATQSAVERLVERSMRLARPFIPTADEKDGDPVSTRALLGFGARTPYYALPAGFVRRRGTGSDFLFSGTFQSEGVRIGLIRIPTFRPRPGAERRAMLRELEGEVAFMQTATDGLIVDVSRNPGGFCSGDVASRLIPQTTQLYRDLLLPSQSDLLFTEDVLDEALFFGAEPWVIELWRFKLESLRSAAAGGVRSLTGPLPGCFTQDLSFFPVEVDSFPPWRDSTGQVASYAKPLIVLQDELSASEAEHFSSLIQDNRRGPVVGFRSPGLGGLSGVIPGGANAEDSLGMTFSLTVRNVTAQAPGIPESPFLETTGVIPDIEIDSMTRENLMNQFRPFFAEVTRAAVNHIRNPGAE
jgi:C-terminal processing protease CtpA/Prc